MCIRDRIYVHDRTVQMGRFQIYNNWSPYMVKDLENTVWVGLENSFSVILHRESPSSQKYSKDVYKRQDLSFSQSLFFTNTRTFMEEIIWITTIRKTTVQISLKS